VSDLLPFTRRQREQIPARKELSAEALLVWGEADGNASDRRRVYGWRESLRAEARREA